MQQMESRTSKDSGPGPLAAAASQAVPVQQPRHVQGGPSQASYAREKAAAVYKAHKQEADANTSKGVPALVIRPARAPVQPQQCVAAAAAPATAPVPTVEQLLAAPRYGLNAKQLILQAAAKAATSSQPKQPGRRQAAPAAQAHDRQTVPIRRLNPMKVLEAIPFADRPFVQFVMRSNIPRLTRQGCSDALLGQYLVLLIDICELCPSADNDAAVQVVKTAVLLREVAGAAAAAHELSVYREVSTKHGYSDKSNKAVATRQTLQQYGGPQLDTLLQQHGLSRDVLQPRPAPAIAAASAVEEQHAVKEGEDLFGEEGEEGEERQEGGEEREEGEGEGEKETKAGGGGVKHGVAEAAGEAAEAAYDACTDHVGAAAAAAAGGGNTPIHEVTASLDSAPAVCKVVLPARVPDAGEHVSQQQPTGPAIFSHEGAVTRLQQQTTGPAILMGEAGVRVARFPPSMGQGNGHGQQHQSSATLGWQGTGGSQSTSHQEESHGSEDSKQGHSTERPLKRAKLNAADSSVQPAPVQGEHGAQTGRGEGGGADANSVTGQVAEFVKGLLDPLYRAQLLSKQAYSDIVRKSVPKIMAHHPGATTAAFLLKEHESVRRYVMKLVDIAASGKAA